MKKLSSKAEEIKKI